jgi:tetratricopeptide (TPR) repeat protein
VYSELAKQFFAARFHLDKLLKLRGPSDDLYVRLGQANAELQQWKEALEMYSRVSDRIRNHDEILARIGLLQLATQTEGCHTTLRRLSTMPEPSASIACGWLFILAGKEFETPDIALQLITNLTKCPQTYATSILLAAIHDCRGEKIVSRRLLEEAAPTNDAPADVRALAILVRANSSDATAQARTKAEALGAVDMTSLTWEQRLRVRLLFERFGVATNTFGQRTAAAADKP